MRSGLVEFGFAAASQYECVAGFAEGQGGGASDAAACACYESNFHE